jgi:hypothetical protein
MVLAPLLLGFGVFAHQPPPLARGARLYAQAAGYAAYHPPNGVLYHRVAPALGGMTLDTALGGGGFITPRVALEGELVLGGDLSGPQRFSYFTAEEYTGHNRQLLVNELVRFRAGSGGSLQVVAGGGYARTTTRETSIVAIDQFGRRTTAPDRPGFPWHGLTWSAGLDVMIASRAHVALAPSLRLRWVQPLNPEFANGVGAFTWQFGAAVFFR